MGRKTSVEERAGADVARTLAALGGGITVTWTTDHCVGFSDCVVQMPKVERNKLARLGQLLTEAVRLSGGDPADLARAITAPVAGPTKG